MNGTRRCWLATAGASLLLTTALAQDAAAPALDFLEYLGAWEDSDEEWLAVSQWEDEATAAGERRDRSAGDRPTGPHADGNEADAEANDETDDEANDEVDDAN